MIESKVSKLQQKKLEVSPSPIADVPLASNKLGAKDKENLAYLRSH